MLAVQFFEIPHCAKCQNDIRKPGEWWVVPNPQLFPKSVSLYRVDRKEEADMVVYYVSTRDSASVRLSTR